MSSKEISDSQDLDTSGGWDTASYVILSVGIVVGLSIIVGVSLGICKYFRKKPKANQPPPSPMCKRQVSVHAQYPPTPHMSRLPKVRRGFSRNSSFKLSITLPKRFQNRASWKVGSLASSTRRFRNFSFARKNSGVSDGNSSSASVSNLSTQSVSIPIPDENLSQVNNVPEPSTA